MNAEPLVSASAGIDVIEGTFFPAAHLLCTALHVLEAYARHSVALVCLCGGVRPGVRQSATALVHTLRAQGFRVKFLRDAAVTKRALEREMARFVDGFPLSRPRLGRFVLYLAGHGVRDGAGDSAFCCYDYSPDKSFSTSFLLKDFKERLLPRIGLQHQLILLNLDVRHHADESVFAAGRRIHVADKFVFARHADCPVVYAVTNVTDVNERTIADNKPQNTSNTREVARSCSPNLNLKHTTHPPPVEFVRALCDQIRSGAVFTRFQSDYCTVSEIFEAARDQYQSHIQTPFLKDVLDFHLGRKCAGEMLFFQAEMSKPNAWNGALKSHRGQSPAKSKHSIYSYEATNPDRLPHQDQDDEDDAASYLIYEGIDEATAVRIKTVAAKAAHKAVARENRRLKDLEGYLREQRRKHYPKPQLRARVLERWKKTRTHHIFY